MLLLDPREQFQKANIEAILPWNHYFFKAFQAQKG